MLERLCQNNDLWIKMALQICNNLDTAKDLVQDMYIYMHNKEGEFNEGYIYFVIKDLFLQTKDKRYLKNRIEFIDLNENIDFDFEVYDYDTDQSIQKDIDLINEALYSCGIYKAIVADSFLEGLRKTSRESGISINTVQKHRKNLKVKLWQKRKD